MARLRRPPSRVGERLLVGVAIVSTVAVASLLLPGGVVVVAAAPTPTTTASAGTTSAPSGTTAPPPKESSVPDPSNKIRALLATLDIMDARRVIPLLEQHLSDVQHSADGAARLVGHANAMLNQAKDDLDRQKQLLASAAIGDYVDPGPSMLEQVIDNDVNESGKRKVMLGVAVHHQRKVVAAAQQVVLVKQQRLQEAEAAKQRADAVVNQAELLVRKGQRRITDGTAQLNQAEADIAANREGTWSLSIMGRNAFTGPELAEWFDGRHVSSKAQAPISDLTHWYIAEGRDEGVRGDMAFAQAIIETGSFTNPDTVKYNNFAGIGHCDNCASGFDFPDPRLGVRAQIQLLKSYAEDHPDYHHKLVDPRLHGPAGCCQSWNDLTRQWATDPTYGPKILDVYRKALDWLVVKRGGQIPPGA